MYDHVIVGGGISGLYMYTQLLKKTNNILLLEKNQYLGGRIYQHHEDNIQFPGGAARFNKNHTHVIQLLKDYDLLDFRKDKGIGSSIDFIDCKNEFMSKFKKKNGFIYIKKVLKSVENLKTTYHLRNYTFSEYAKKCLTKNELDFMLKASGYSGQLKHMNMHDAYFLFKNGIRDDITFYAGYYHLLIEKMVAHLRKNKANLKINSDVQSITFDNVQENYVLKYQNKTVKTKNIILCIPQPALLKLDILEPIHYLLKNSVNCKPLCRVYAQFKKEDVWFQNIGKTVTNNALRYIIPMDAEKGLIMISYTDDIYTKFWENQNINSKKCKEKVVKLVKQTFGLTINEPVKMWKFYWDCGVAYWKKGVHSEEISDYLTNPIQNIYICGENYSLTQSWVEGSLESCEKALSCI